MIKIAPSILSADFTNLEKEILNIQKAGADILHLDIMDGHFVPNLTFGLPLIKQIKQLCRIPVDVHLMVKNPELYLKELGKWKIEYVSIHQETVIHLHRQISILKSLGIKAGIALNPATPVETVFSIIQEIDYVLLMSVNPGFGGQQLLPLVYNKIKKLKAYSNEFNSNLKIEVDGGINNLNVRKLIELGADIIVAGSYIFENKDYKKQIDNLRIE